MTMKRLESDAPRPLAYLASPYSDPDPHVRERRFHAANLAAAKLMNLGEIVFSPISHSHPIAVDSGLLTDWEFWQEFDRAILPMCYKIYVMQSDGWDQSVGVQREIEIANEIGIPVEYI